MTGSGKSGRSGKARGRDQRLAAALRDNLKRRKAQARGRGVPTSQPRAKSADKPRDE